MRSFEDRSGTYPSLPWLSAEGLMYFLKPAGTGGWYDSSFNHASVFV